MKKSLLVTFIFITLFTVANSFARKDQDSLSYRVDSMFARHVNAETPGLAVLVIQNGKVLLERGYGTANLEYKVPITPTTVFDIASLSKQFTGMAISMLIEQGKISLNDDIRKYIPEMPDFGHKITIDNLVHHTSGLRDWPGTLSLAGCRLDDVISFEQILNMTFNQQDLNFEPGSEYSYSNTGYNILAELVHRVTGKTFREWTDTNIFQPLGMVDTHFCDDYSEVVVNKAYGYSRWNGKFHAVNNGLTAYGSSSLYSTIDDLAKWIINLDNPKVGGKVVVDRLFQQGILNNGTRISYAFGLEINKYRGLKEITHSGSWASYSTYLAFFPEQHFSIVVLHNSPSDSYRAAHDIADIYLSDKLEQPVKANKPENFSTDSVDVPISVLNDYVGVYRLGIALYVTITMNGTQLMAYATGEQGVAMTALSYSTFWVRSRGDSIKFNRNNVGRVISFNFHGMTCLKSENASPPNQLDDFTGEYISDELKTLYTITIENGTLVAKHRRHGKISLIHAWKDIFQGGVWFMNSVEFYRDNNGEIAGFIVTENRSRNQRFIKQISKENKI